MPKHEEEKPDATFVGMFVVLHVVAMICYFCWADYSSDAFSLTATSNGAGNGSAANQFFFKVGTVSGTYSFYTDVAVMLFIGFGFLMTFLKKYAFSALGYTFLLTCFVIEMVILVEGLVESAGKHKIMLDVTSLVRGLFGSGAVMISFGAVLGRATPRQLLVMAFLEVWVYVLNEYIGAYKLKAVDMGGSMFVHEFGAYFGLAVALGLQYNKSAVRQNREHPDNASRYDSDVSAMVGTLFLWILWPSFNGALAPTPDAKMRVVVNTVFSLCGSCIAAFVVSHLTKRGKFDMVHVQNATLAGGVAVGSSSDLLVGPGGSILIGTIAGVISVLGYEYLSPWMERALRVQDTCGVHNLHGLPGLIGGITGAISCAAAEATVYGQPYEQLFSEGRTPGNQWKYQLGAMFITLGLALSGGVMTGVAMRLVGPGGVAEQGQRLYDDAGYWETPAAEQHGGAKDPEHGEATAAVADGVAQAEALKTMDVPAGYVNKP